MGKRLIARAALLTLLALTPPAWAGLYNSAEEDRPGVNVQSQEPLAEFQDLLARLRSIATPGPTESLLRKRYLLVSRLDVRARDLDVEQRIDLGAYLVRLGKYDEAIEALRPAEAQQPRNFRVLSNLGTANQLAGHLDRAEFYLEQTLKHWPKKTPPGFETAQLERFRVAEEYQLKLVRLRAREAARSRGPVGMPESVDDLFGVRFVGDGGSYQAGTLAADQKARLPDDARRIVEQLLVWLPGDLRLYWLWGELLNVQGKVPEAEKVFTDLVFNQRWNAAELREHRRVLQDWVANQPAPAGGSTAPRDAEPAPARGRMSEILTWAGVGALGGGLVTLLAVFQVRELRRRFGHNGASR